MPITAPPKSRRPSWMAPWARLSPLALGRIRIETARRLVRELHKADPALARLYVEKFKAAEREAAMYDGASPEEFASTEWAALEESAEQLLLVRDRDERGRPSVGAAMWREFRVRFIYGDLPAATAARYEDCTAHRIRQIRRTEILCP